MELKWFFVQWLERPGMPKLAGTWTYNPAAKRVELELQQVQTGPAYQLPLEIGLTTTDGQLTVERVELKTSQGRFTINTDKEPVTIVMDPNTWTLLESANITRRSQP